MIKVYLNKTFPKIAQEPDYRGLTQLGTNVGPGNLEDVLIGVTVTLVDFWAVTHQKETREEILNRVLKALSVLESNIVIEKAIE